MRWAGDGSPVQVVDVVEGGGLGEAHPGLPDVFTAVNGLHVLHRLLGGGVHRDSVRHFSVSHFSSARRTVNYDTGAGLKGLCVYRRLK